MISASAIMLYLVAASKEGEVLWFVRAARADTLHVRGDVLRLVEGDAQTLGSHGWSPLLHNRISAITCIHM